ncbi:MAG: acetyl-CoA carboxylase biotin carboxyl carrier protein [Oscillospiraceae bacterium]
MGIDTVKALAEILNKSGLTSLEYCEGDTKIRLEKTGSAVPAISARTEVPAKSENPSAGDPGVSAVDFNNLIEVKSPLVGVFYSSASPESAPFVSIGSKVKKGDVLCVIEAMKLMNELTAEAEGEIVDICIKNGEIAEYGQVLFKMF